MNTGIVSYASHIPNFRITAEEIARAWNKDGAHIAKSLKIQQKAVADIDEDSATLGIQASITALENAKIAPTHIGALYVGSESHPYAVKPTATIIGEALGLSNSYFAADLEFACKAGTAGLQIVSFMVQSGNIEYGLAVGSDTAQGAPNDALEFSAASGAAAFIVGNKKDEIIAQLIDTVSFSSDTPDFWRPSYTKYPEHGGRFTGEPAYYTHVIEATKLLLEKTNSSITDYNHVVFHMPNGNFPARAAKKLGVTPQQLEAGFVVPTIGNTYSACSMIGLTAALDKAQPGEKILVTSYGSGSGSDSFAFEVTENIAHFTNNSPFEKQNEQTKHIPYSEYLVMRGKI